MDGSSTLQLMHAPGSSVKGSGTRSWQVLQICGREGGGCMVGGGSWKLAPGLMMKLLFSPPHVLAAETRITCHQGTWRR